MEYNYLIRDNFKAELLSTRFLTIHSKSFGKQRIKSLTVSL